MGRVQVRYCFKKITGLQNIFAQIRPAPLAHDLAICKLILLATKWDDEFTHKF